MNVSEFVPLLLGILLLVVLVVALVRPMSTSRSKAGGPIIRDDDRYWFGGIYYNPNDPDIMVPKRYGFGQTLNVGHPLGKLIMIGLVLLGLALAVLKALSH